MNANTSQNFFEQKYRQSSDPWSFSTSPYELDRYAAIVASLAGRMYLRAFEPGCSVGVLTERLSPLCVLVEAIEISPTATGLARERCRLLSNVDVCCASISDYIPDSFDLLVFCEIGYYFSIEKLRCLLSDCIWYLASGGIICAAHWLGRSPDHLLDGDTVHQTLASMPGLVLEHSERHQYFRLDRWRKSSEVSL
jgi:SAM-dependent methyltransferase